MKIYRSPRADITIPNVSITDHILRHADRLADHTAFVEGMTGRKVSFGELRDQVRRLAGGLVARGVGPGTTWALMAPNLPEYAVVFHAVAYAGATVTTLNPTYGVEELSFQLRDSKARAIVTVEMFLETAKAAAAKVGIDTVVVIGPSDALPLSELMGPPLEAQVEVDLAEHVVVLPYSSGTTGFPKGVMLTHRNMVANLVQSETAAGMEEGHVVFAVLPFFHIYGMNVLMNLALSMGASLVTLPRFDLVKMLEAIQTYKITRLPLVPPIVLALAKHPIVEQYDLSSVESVLSGAAPLGGEIGEAVAARVGCTVKQGFGMTELSPVSHMVGADREAPPGTVGTLVSNTEARLVDPGTGEDAPEGERGELWIRGPQVMKGYLENPTATQETITPEGWLRTGDIATVDAEGNFAIVDRLKELIKFKGFQVAPAELEALLQTMPGVQDVAVIGIPDDEAGELPKAFVVAGEGADLTLEGVQAFMSSHVSSYKQVRRLEVIEAIPKSASGKILRRELRVRG
ncbi:MAG: AMP-binding protein [Myxococcota bacterium]